MLDMIRPWSRCQYVAAMRMRGYWTSDDGCCWVVSDGAGGHGSGDVASRLVVSTGAAPLLGPSAGGAGRGLEPCSRPPTSVEAGEKTNGNTRDDMHATAVVLLIDPRSGLAVWGHVGDTRIYLFRRGRVAYQTRDHSLVQKHDRRRPWQHRHDPHPSPAQPAQSRPSARPSHCLFRFRPSRLRAAGGRRVPALHRRLVGIRRGKRHGTDPANRSVQRRGWPAWES